MDWLLNREVVIALAVVGALASLAASLFRERLGHVQAAWLNRCAYTLTGASIVIFIVLGFMTPS
jgi:predicted membrane-bound mannosyltransferase